MNKAGDFAGARPDFEIIVRIADRAGFKVQNLVPFRGAMRADMGQSRGAQSGEADQHLVWLRANKMEPKLSPFDPAAILDEIQRLVPGYQIQQISRLELVAGNDVHTSAPEASGGAAKSDSQAIVPSEDTLFTSGTLGRYSQTLNSVMENRRTEPVPPTSPALAGD